MDNNTDTGPSWLDYARLGASFLLWIVGGMAVAALGSQWESIVHGDGQEFALSRMAMNLILGAVVGFIARLFRLAKGG